MDTKKRDEIIQKLATYILHYCPMGALQRGEVCDVALCYPRKSGFNGTITAQEVKRLADGSLLDLSLKDIKAVATSRKLARLVGVYRTSFIKATSSKDKGSIRLSQRGPGGS